MRHNWDLKSFTDVATTITPISKIEKSEYMKTGLYPIISQEDSLISGYWNNPNDLTPHHAPVVIFGDHTRVLKYVDFEFAVGADGVKIIQPKDNLNAKFLYHYLHWLNIPSLGYSRHFKLIKEAKFSVPPLKVQEQIVVELDKINEIISDCKEAIRNLDTLAQSLFYDYFGDPITNPKGWDVLSFDDCIYKTKYPVKLQTKDYQPFGLYPIISQEEKLISGYTDIEECVYKVTKPVVIFGDHTRIVKYVPFSFALGADGVKILNPVDSLQVKYFYFCLLLFKIPSLGYSRHYRLLKKKEIPVPPLPLQVKFATRIEHIEQQKKDMEESIANMQTLLKSRMDYWFN